MAKHVVAVDIGAYSIKALQGEPGKTVHLEKSVLIENPLNVHAPTDDASSEKFAQLIDNLFNDHALNRLDVRLSLPEPLVSTKIISIPPLTDAELASAITWQAEQNIPIPLEELSLEYQVLYRPEKKDKDAVMHVLMIGARKPMIERYISAFVRAGIEPTLLETQMVSVLRSLQFTSEDPTTLVVHMGAFHTDMAIVNHGELRFVYTQPNGGQTLTRAIEQTVQLTTTHAEEYKRTYGLNDAQLQGKMSGILTPLLKNMTLSMQKAMQFFVSDTHEEPVRRVLLSGGSAQLPGFVEFITNELNVEVLVAAPFVVADGQVPQADQPAFTVTMGLLMRE